MAAQHARSASSTQTQRPGPLAGIRVIELADEQAEYCGLTLAGLGADVVKVEPPGGSPTRRIGPFYEDQPGPERSLFFWQYNRGKRSVVLDLEQEKDRERFRTLISTADILLESTPKGYLDRLGLGIETLTKQTPSLIVARVTPFGDEGPWSDFKACDLVHLALGGVMMNCGYDPAPGGKYDLPPIAPQMWHAYHIAGEQLTFTIVAALLYRFRTGKGQVLSCPIHEAVSVSTEVDLMTWVMRHALVLRQTCRHARESVSPSPSIAHTKDGRWVMASLGNREGEAARLTALLDKYGIESGELDQAAMPKGGRFVPGTGPIDKKRDLAMEAVQRFVRAFTYENVPWREAQEAGMLWAPLRKPDESASDPHWLKRGSVTDIEHPEVGRAFRYATSKWISTATDWAIGRRAPLLNEDADTIMAPPKRIFPVISPNARIDANEPPSRRGQPFPLHRIRILDFTWFLASAGGTRFLSAFGAESIKVELKSHPDTRLAAMAPIGGREARDKATAPLKGVTDTNMGGQFNNKNPGKRGISLNVRHPKGLEIAKRLVAMSDIVAEGFSPGVLDNWGLGYETLKSIKPDIIYVQQSGMGAQGTYGRFRTVGPIANAFAGLSEMSGLPEPAMPAGWGYSYLDWMGAYSFALAMLSALFHRERTGEGQWIDASQTEVGLFICGTAVLDWSANERIWTRYGNRSPYKPAAPHGVYPCAGDDRWMTIACFTEVEWQALCKVTEHPEWAKDPRFVDLAARLKHQPALDQLLGDWTKSRDAYQAMLALQHAGVPAGVCQTAGDRCDNDPQLKALEWLTEVTGTKIGRWPVAEVPIKMSESPAFIGGHIDRGAPCYGEDNEYVFGELLGMSSQEIAKLAEEGVFLYPLRGAVKSFLDLYFERIGYTGTPKTDLETLRELHLLHMQRIPYENIDVFSLQSVSLAREALIAKMLMRRRGGYCFEQNGLFGMALAEIGFQFSPNMARVHRNRPAPGGRTHHINLVELEGATWVCDVGFGGSAYRYPLMLEPDAEAEQLGERYRFRRSDEHGFFVEKNIGQGWEPQYTFKIDLALPIDMAMANFYTSRSADHTFLNAIIGTRMTETGRVTLRDHTFKRFDLIEGSVRRETVTDFDTYVAKLREHLGVELNEDEKRRFRDRFATLATPAQPSH